MVSPGQFLERPTLIPVGGEVMEGLSHRGEQGPPLLIVPPPPEEGGGMEHAVAAEVVWAAAMAGHPTLRFNFRGVGASQGRRSGPGAQIEDAQQALRLLEENTRAPTLALVTLGGSAQTGLELLRAHSTLAGLCFIAPAGLDLASLTRLSVPLCIILGEEDHREPRAALVSALSGPLTRLEVIEDTDAAFTRNLPQVGKAVVSWLTTLERPRTEWNALSED